MILMEDILKHRVIINSVYSPNLILYIALLRQFLIRCGMFLSYKLKCVEPSKTEPIKQEIRAIIHMVTDETAKRRLMRFIR